VIIKYDGGDSLSTLGIKYDGGDSLSTLGRRSYCFVPPLAIFHNKIINEYFSVAMVFHFIVIRSMIVTKLEILVASLSNARVKTEEYVRICYAMN
jgi:hypothetical protein